jgi:hypothetical protein
MSSEMHYPQSYDAKIGDETLTFTDVVASLMSIRRLIPQPYRKIGLLI